MLIPYYIVAVPTNVLLVDEAAFARQVVPLWLLKTSYDKDCVGRFLYFQIKDTIRGEFLIPTLITVVGVELMRHHWHIDEHMGDFVDEIEEFGLLGTAGRIYELGMDCSKDGMTGG